MSWECHNCCQAQAIIGQLNDRIAELEKKNADVKFELDAALGWYEKWQKIASDRSKEILRLMEVESESKRKDEVLVWDADKILECTTRIVEQSERIAELEAEVKRLREALEIIAGKRQCINNLMSNVEIAEAALLGGGDE